MKADSPDSSSKELITILDRLGLGYYRSDLEGRIVFINKAGASILGISRGALGEGIGVQDFYVDNFDRDLLRKQIEEYGYIGSYIARGRRRDGTEIYMNVTVRAIKDEEAKSVGYEGVFREVTNEVRTVRDELHLRKRLERRNEDLLALLTLQEKLLSSLAHDINTPPVVAIGLTELLLRGYFGEITPKQEAPLRKILRNSQGVTSLVEALLLFTRYLKRIRERLPGESSLVSVWEKAKRNAGELPTLRANRLRLEALDSSPIIPVSTEVLMPLVENLLFNCLRYAPEESRVLCRIRPKPPGAVLEVSIENLPAEQLAPEKMLNVFFPTTRGEINGDNPQNIASLGLAAACYAARVLDAGLTASKSTEDLPSFVLEFA